MYEIVYTSRQGDRRIVKCDFFEDAEFIAKKAE